MFQWGNSIQYAQEKTGKVTAKMLRGVLASLHQKGAARGALAIHGEAVYGRASCSDSFIFTLSASAEARRVNHDIRPVTTTVKIDVPGYVSNGYTSVRAEEASTPCSPYMRYTEPFRPEKGFWYLPYQWERLENIVALLPADAEVALFVALDDGTQEYLVRSDVAINRETHRGLHADSLYLGAQVTRGGKVQDMHFLIDTDTLPHNSARFGVTKADAARIACLVLEVKP